MLIRGDYREMPGFAPILELPYRGRLSSVRSDPCLVFIWGIKISIWWVAMLTHINDQPSTCFSKPSGLLLRHIRHAKERYGDRSLLWVRYARLGPSVVLLCLKLLEMERTM